MSEAKRILELISGSYPEESLLYLSNQFEEMVTWIDLRRIVEVGGAKISRLHQYISDPDTPFAQISGFSDTRTRQENLKCQAGLLFDLKQASFVVIATKGFWNGKGERSFFVAGKGWEAKQFQQVIQSLANKYQQWTYILGAGDEVAEYDSKTGQTVRKFSRIEYDPTKISSTQPHARLKGRKLAMIEQAGVFSHGPVRAGLLYKEMGLTEAASGWKEYRSAFGDSNDP